MRRSRRSLEIYPSWATVAEQHGGFQDDSQLQGMIQYPDAKYTYSCLISKSNIFLINERMFWNMYSIYAYRHPENPTW